MSASGFDAEVVNHGCTEILPHLAMLRRQDNRANATTFSRKLVVFVLVVFCAPAFYLIIGESLT